MYSALTSVRSIEVLSAPNGGSEESPDKGMVPRGLLVISLEGDHSSSAFPALISPYNWLLQNMTCEDTKSDGHSRETMETMITLTRLCVEY